MVSRFLPEQLRHLPVVDLSYGGFELTPYITSKTLSMLNLSHNGLVALPEAIGDLSSLTHLFVSDNYLSFLPATLKRLKHLRVLDLRNNQLQELLNDIIDLSFLERLSVKGNPLAVEEIRKLMELTDKREGFTVDAAGKYKLSNKTVRGNNIRTPLSQNSGTFSYSFVFLIIDPHNSRFKVEDTLKSAPAIGVKRAN